MRWRKITYNPAASADPPKKSSAPVRELSYWSPQEAREFLAFVANEHNFALWRTYLGSGCRRGELLALRMKDIDLEAGVLTVARSLVAVGYEPTFSTPKNGKTRRVDLDKDTVAVLRKHVTVDRLALGLGKAQPDDLVFLGLDGRALHPDAVSNRWNSLVKRSGLKRIRLHDARHTHAALAIDGGADPKSLQMRLGHHSVAFTLDRYGHLFPARQREIADAIGERLSEQTFTS